MNLYMTENQKRKLTEVVTLIPENVKDILQEIRIPANSASSDHRFH